MYVYETEELRREKLEADASITFQMILLYIRSFFVPESEQQRKVLLNELRTYLEYSKCEKQILAAIDSKYGYTDEVPCVEEVLNDLDEMFEKYYDYIDRVLSGYEDMIDLNEAFRANIIIKKPVIINKENKQEFLSRLD